MKESTKRVIDLLTLPVLGLLAAVIWFGYINNSHPSKIWAVLLMFDIPFAAAALIWLGWRLLSGLPRGGKNKAHHRLACVDTLRVLASHGGLVSLCAYRPRIGKFARVVTHQSSFVRCIDYMALLAYR
jgi:hypothetical protein